jgi:O-antigen ligase
METGHANLTASALSGPILARWVARAREVSPATVLLISFGAGFVIRPSPVWAMLFYLTVLPVCGARLGKRGLWPSDAGSVVGVTLILWFTLATCWDVAAGSEIGPHVFWVWNGLCTLVMFVASRAAFGTPGRDRERLITTLIAGALVNTTIVFVRTAFTGIADGRLGGWAETRHPILGASMIGTCAILAAGRMLAGRRARFEAITVLACLVFIVLTGSRGPLLAITVSLGLLAALLQPRLLISVIVIGLFLLVMVEFADPGILDHAWARLLERGWSSRLDIWQLALEEIARRPILGYGPSTRLNRATDNFPHDLFLSTIFYSGAIGLVLLLLLLALAARAAYRQPDHVRRATGIVLLVHLILSGLTDLSQVTKGPGPLWYIIWVPIILALGPASSARGEPRTPVDPEKIHAVERFRA